VKQRLNRLVCKRCGCDAMVQHDVPLDMFIAFCPACVTVEQTYGGNWKAFEKVDCRTSAFPNSWLRAILPSPPAPRALPFPFSIPAHPLTGQSSGIKVGEVLAWRSWRVRADGLLFSMAVQIGWHPKEPMTGEVDRRYGASILGGVHAWKSQQQAYNYGIGWLQHTMIDSSRHDFTAVAVGQVALWGIVDEHEHGYRAEYGRVHSIEYVVGPTGQWPKTKAHLHHIYDLTEEPPQMTDQCAIVGMHFRPPAKAIMAVLPTGAELRLEREPENQYDVNAVKVLVASAAIPKSQHEDLDLQASGFGHSLEEILAEPFWHLGYIAAKPPKGREGCALATVISPRLAKGEPYKAKLVFDSAGLPLAEVTWGEP